MTQELTKAKGLEPGDRVFARALNQRLIHSLRSRCRGGSFLRRKAEGRHGLVIAARIKRYSWHLCKALKSQHEITH